MSQPKPAQSTPHGTDPAATPVVEPGFEVALHAFWDKNRNLVLGACVVALLAIVVREGLQYFAAIRERGVQTEFAQVADQPAKLAAFADAHQGHALAGVAWLQLADDKFTARDYSGAVTAYQKAAAEVKNDALLARARLGAAISQVSGADKPAGEAALKALSADTNISKNVRAEAAYHLATIALEAGNAEEVRRLVDQVGRIDAASVWSQRATGLLTALPAGGKPAEGTSPSLTFKPAGK
jgi:hypothetical protein